MSNKLLKCLTAGAMAATLAFASPALARGGGHGGGFGGGGMRGGMGMHGGGMHVGGMGGGMRAGGMGGMRVGGMGFAGSRAGFVGPRFAGPRFAHAPFVRHGRFFHHRHHRFAFIGVGVPYAYAAYDGCWRRTWTPYGLQWINVCSAYGYYGYY
jgi:hypothetical protein